jgi:hypothetical protein
MQQKEIHRTAQRIVQMLLLVMCITFFIIGLMRGEYSDIFTNADNMCYSCMGLE